MEYWSYGVMGRYCGFRNAECGFEAQLKNNRTLLAPMGMTQIEQITAGTNIYLPFVKGEAALAERDLETRVVYNSSFTNPFYRGRDLKSRTVHESCF